MAMPREPDEPGRTGARPGDDPVPGEDGSGCPGSRPGRRLGWLAAPVLLAIHAGLLAYGAWRHSPACGEVAHLPAGLSHWQFRRYELYRVNPPLVRMVAALPVLAVGARTDWGRYFDLPGARPEFSVGAAFVAANGGRSFWLYTLARWACIPFSLLGGYVCWRWASELHGASAGLVALALWCSSPDILAHGQMITPDAAASALGVTAAYLFWRWLKDPGWSRALAAGSVLGLAELTKTSWVFLFALWPLLWVLRCLARADARRPARGRLGQGAQLATLLLAGLYVMNLAYGFEGTGTRLRSYLFVSEALRGRDATGLAGNRFADSWCGSIPVPLPISYVRGIDEQKKDLEHVEWPSYLRGRMRDRGWWYFYLYGLAVKLPLGTILLAAMALAFPPYRRAGAWADAAVLLAPPLVLLALLSSQSGFSIHYRYAIPVLPFLFIWASRAVPAAANMGRGATALVLTAVIGSAGSSLSVYPHSLSYFHEAAGGPAAGHYHMVYSAIDWGQDLLDLRRWLSDHPEARPLRLAYYGFFDPRHAGIESTPPPTAAAIRSGGPGTNPLETGWYAVSVTFLRGIPVNPALRSTYDAYSYFRRLPPAARIGYSIYLYHLNRDDVDGVARRLRDRPGGGDGTPAPAPRGARHDDE